MSDYPGCDCGHPWADPSWIDHKPSCPYLLDVLDLIPTNESEEA